MSDRSFSSRSIQLGKRLLGASTLAAGALMLAGCQKTGEVYPDAQACVAAQVFTATYCNENFKLAQAEHTRLAPHYASRQDCEKDWSDGQCDQDQIPATGHVIYYPHMSGYWIGYGQRAGSGADAASHGGQRFSYPVYKTQDGGFYSPATDQSFDSAGPTYESPDTATAHSVETASRPVFARGSSFSSGASTGKAGFGATARGFGFGVGE